MHTGCLSSLNFLPSPHPLTGPPAHHLSPLHPTPRDLQLLVLRERPHHATLRGLECRILAPIFRKPTRVSLLSWFPETPTMYDVLCTHNTTGFVFNKCAVPTMHFALYTQSEYTPTIRVYQDEALYTQSQYAPTMQFAVYTQWLNTHII